jgi:hypothetical protein
MPRPLSEILAEARELVTGDYTIESLAGDVQKGWPELHQFIFNGGHKKASAQHGSDIRAVEKKLEDEQAVSEGLRKQIKKLEEKVPEAAQLRQEYETREQNLRKEFETKLTEANGKVEQLDRGSGIQKLIDELSNDENLVHRPYAKDLAEGRFADRFTRDEKGTRMVLQIGQKIPYAAATEDEAIKLLAKDIAKTVEPWGKRSGVERGGGLRNEGPAGGERVKAPEDIKTQKKSTGDYASF